MAQIEPEYEIMAEAEKIVVTLCEMYAEKLGHVIPEAVGVAAITNKERPETQRQDSQIIGVKAPITLYTQKRYVIQFFKSVWDKYTPSQRVAMLMKNLLRIAEEFNGKINPEDLKDCKCLVKAFGVDYIENPNLPDLTQTKQAL